MNAINLKLADDLTGCPFPFFGEPVQPAEKVYKIYNDGGHYIATRVFRKATRKPKDLPVSTSKYDYTQEQQNLIYRGIMRDKKKRVDEHGKKRDKTAVDKMDLSTHNGTRLPLSAMDILFDSLYYQAYKRGLRDNKVDKAMTDYIRAGILKLYPYTDDLDGYITDKIKRKYNNLLHRKKRFRRKANLNRWNYFVTFTYDDTKQTAESFKKKLRKCLSNLHTRRGWKYMGVFEEAPETGRLHFHGLVYVPAGQMLGTIAEKQDYSTVKHELQTRHENSFFENNFGRNDFCEVSLAEMRNGKSTDYILKYIGKTNERICYSRGIPTEICRKIDDNDIIAEMRDFVTKYILFDDVIDWERDVMRYRYNKQMSITELLCNPLLSA